MTAVTAVRRISARLAHGIPAVCSNSSSGLVCIDTLPNVLARTPELVDAVRTAVKRSSICGSGGRSVDPHWTTSSVGLCVLGNSGPVSGNNRLGRDHRRGCVPGGKGITEGAGRTWGVVECPTGAGDFGVLDCAISSVGGNARRRRAKPGNAGERRDAEHPATSGDRKKVAVGWGSVSQRVEHGCDEPFVC